MAKRHHKSQSLSRAIKRGNKIVVKTVAKSGGLDVLRVPHHNKANFMRKNSRDRAKDTEKLFTTPPEVTKEKDITQVQEDPQTL